MLLTVEQSFFFFFLYRDGSNRVFTVVDYNFYFILLTLAIKIVWFSLFIQFQCKIFPSKRSHCLELFF